MKRIFFYFLAAAFILSCKPDEATKGFDNIQLTLNSDIFNYRIKLDIADENGDPLPPGAEVKILGEDADAIYNEFGVQEYIIDENGKLNLTVDPRMEPTEQDSIHFDLLIDADGFEKGVTQVSFGPNEFVYTEEIGLASDQELADTYNLEKFDVPVSNGVVQGERVITGKKGGVVRVLNKAAFLDSIYYDNNNVAVLVKSGATFWKYEDIKFSVPVRPELTREIFDTISINGKKEVVPKKEYYYGDTIWETRSRTVRSDYTGSSFDIDIFYTYRDHSYGSQSSGDNRQVATLFNGTDALGRAFRERVTTTRINKVRYIGEDASGFPITIYPKNSEDIMYSFVVDTTLTNPNTGQPWRENDLVENGVKWNSRNTIETTPDTIRKAGNGQLRIQSSRSQPGIWNFFQYETPIDFTYNINPPDSITIPDLENLWYSYSTEVIISSGGSIRVDRDRGLVIYRSNRSRNRSVTIYTTDPGTSVITEVENEYFGNNWNTERTISKGSGNIEVLDQQLYSQIQNPATKYDLKVICAGNDSAVILPSAAASTALSGDLSGRANIRLTDGKWATRGFKVGDSLAFRFSYKDWKFDTTYVIEFLDNRIEFVDENNVDVCDF